MRESSFPIFGASRYLLIRLGNQFVLWLYTWAFNLTLTVVGSLIYRTRMSHNNGIGAAGTLKIVDNLDFPLHPFFEPGRVFPCRIRHAAASFLDDAMRTVRSMSIKFSDHLIKSPFDLELNTGNVALFWSAACFLRFAKYKKTQYGIEYHQYYRNYPAGVKGAFAGLRRNPTSFHNQHYYCQTPFFYKATDNVLRYAKYRALPAEDVPQSGLLDAYEHEILTENQRILPGETRSRNYLKEAYARQVKEEGPLRYILQIQLHTASDDDSPEVFNCCRQWDEASHPWMNLAEITIHRTLDWRESTLMMFSMKNMPKGLGLLPAYSIFDYNSLNYMRKRSDIARRARVLADRVFGVPQPIPNDNNRNV